MRQRLAMPARCAFLFTVLMCAALLIEVVPAHGVAATYNNVEELLILDSALPPSGTCPDCPFDLLNNTGSEWTDFHFRTTWSVGEAELFGMINAAAGPFDGVGYEGAGTAVFNPDPFASQLDVTGLSIPDGATYSFTLDLTFVEQQIGTLHLFGLPSIDGTTQVPAPASLVLVGVAMLGLAVARRRIGRV